MDDDFWLKIYRDWDWKTLHNEIGVCHRYQQDLLARAAQGLLPMDHGLRLMITSQLRESIIMRVIKEKVKNGDEETNSN